MSKNRSFVVLFVLFVFLSLWIPIAQARTEPSTETCASGSSSDCQSIQQILTVTTPAATDPPREPTATNPPRFTATPTRPPERKTATPTATPITVIVSTVVIQPTPTATLPPLKISDGVIVEPTYDPNPKDITFPPATPTPGSIAVKPMADLEVTAMEITQGMQNLANQMPLVGNRWTNVRVYIETDGGNLAGVKGLLIAIKNGQQFGPIAAANQPIIVKEDGGDRINVDDSLYFNLPGNWTDPGSTTFKVFVYKDIPGTAFNQEADSENNFFEVNVTFEQQLSREIKFVTMHNHDYSGGDKGGPSNFLYYAWNAGPKVLSAVYRFLPVTSINAWINFDYLQPADHPGLTHDNDWNLSSCDGDINYDAELQALSSLIANENDDALYYGMLREDQDIWIGCNSGFTGAARYGVSIGIMSYNPSNSSPWYFGGGATLVHEMFHNLAVSAHIPCSGNEASGGAIDNNYPYLNPCSIAEVDEEGYYGFDVYWSAFSPDLTGPTVISNDPNAAQPNYAMPTMSYSSPKWTSSRNWCISLNVMGIACNPGAIGIGALQSAPKVAALRQIRPKLQSDDGEYLLAIGLIDSAANTVQLHEMRRITDPSWNALETAAHNDGRVQDMLDHGETPAYRLVLKDTAGGILAERYLVDTSTAHVDDTLTTLGFYDLIPWVDGAAVVQVLSGEAVLFERSVSANAPQVTLLTPNGGESITEGPLLVSWKAIDPDGDDLQYFLQYSADNGDSWKSIANNLVGYTTVEIESLKSLPGGSQSLFRITASDGINSASDTSDAVFALPDQAPGVMIFSPAVVSAYPTNELVQFSASVTDPEDGPINGDALVWESDIDGLLGTGAAISTQDLTPGLHHVTLRAIDSAGNSAESFVDVYIDPNVVRDRPAEAEMAEGLAYLNGERPAVQENQEDVTAEPTSSPSTAPQQPSAPAEQEAEAAGFSGRMLFLVLGVGAALVGAVIIFTAVFFLRRKK